jgi:sulfur-carrier protein adenylyltransferase/sulfurtransferase
VPVDHARYGRQVRLPEIGEAGQERLSAATVALSATGFAREIEATYLRLAGARPVSADADVRPRAVKDPASLGLRHAAAREVGEGAFFALSAMHAVLGPRGDG